MYKVIVVVEVYGRVSVCADPAWDSPAMLLCSRLKTAHRNTYINKFKIFKLYYNAIKIKNDTTHKRNRKLNFVS